MRILVNTGAVIELGTRTIMSWNRPDW